MKLPQLLSQFLYQYKKLDLPGIGSFTLDATVVIPDTADKSLHTPASGISFKNTIIQAPDDALILFIKEYTGKMKPLAAADLDFFLTTGKQLLNIGKPFYLDGIGTLHKNKEGRLDFVPGEYSTDKLEEPGAEKRDKSDKRKISFEDPPTEYEPHSNNIRQALLLIGIIGGLVVIGWGGYYLYKRNTYVEPQPESTATVIPDTTATARQTPADSSSMKPATPPPSSPSPAKRPDSTVASALPIPGPGASLYKFVILRSSNKEHALRRFNQLLGYQLNIKMDQKDSTYFKLYFPIAAAPRDTTHIKDSLIDVYAAHVTIER